MTQKENKCVKLGMWLMVIFVTFPLIILIITVQFVMFVVYNLDKNNHPETQDLYISKYK